MQGCAAPSCKLRMTVRQYAAQGYIELILAVCRLEVHCGDPRLALAVSVGSPLLQVGQEEVHALPPQLQPPPPVEAGAPADQSVDLNALPETSMPA